jgi:hypothetical protein
LWLLFAEDTIGKKVLIPVPVPIYVPAPMHMYSSPYPVPVPFPLPVPVPIFIPTTRNSAHGIMKEIKVSIGFRFNANIFVPLGLNLHTLW